jgi:hypothetical protein
MLIRLIGTLILLASLFFSLVGVAGAGEMACPAPTQQLAKDVEADLKASVAGLGKLKLAEIDGKVATTTTEFFSKYPNADKVAIANSLISLYCEYIKTANLSHDEAAERLDKITQALLPILMPPHTDAAPINFPTDVFAARMFVTKIRIPLGKITVVQLRNGTCNMRIWLPELVVFPDSGNDPPFKIAMTDSGRYATEFPFDYKIYPDGSALKDAAKATRAQSIYTKEDLDAFFSKAPEMPGQLVYLAIRATQDGCTGQYSLNSEDLKKDEVEPSICVVDGKEMSDPKAIAQKIYDQLEAARHKMIKDHGANVFNFGEVRNDDGSSETLGIVWGTYLRDEGFPSEAGLEICRSALVRAGFPYQSADGLSLHPANVEVIDAVLKDLHSLAK